MIENDFQLENSRAKLERLKAMYEATKTRPMVNEHVRELTLWSVKKRINMMIEEITWYECGCKTARK